MYHKYLSLVDTIGVTIVLVTHYRESDQKLSPYTIVIFYFCVSLSQTFLLVLSLINLKSKLKNMYNGSGLIRLIQIDEFDP